MHRFEIVNIEVRVALGHVDAAVAEEFLYVPEIGTGADEMGGDGVPKRKREPDGVTPSLALHADIVGSCSNYDG